MIFDVNFCLTLFDRTVSCVNTFGTYVELLSDVARKRGYAAIRLFASVFDGYLFSSVRNRAPTRLCASSCALVVFFNSQKRLLVVGPNVATFV